MNQVTQNHIDRVIYWVEDTAYANRTPSITNDRFASLSVLVEEFKRLKIENECLTAIFVQAMAENHPNRAASCEAVALK